MLISIGLDHRMSPVADRECLTRNSGSPELGAEGALSWPLLEFLVLSTCNRFELYGWADPSAPETRVWEALERRWPSGAEARALLGPAIRRKGQAAALHLLRVAAGLESEIAGDGQILAQVRRAYKAAVEAGTAGPALHRLLQAALRTGRRVGRETGFTRHGRSAASEAAALIARRAGVGVRSRIVILGAGKMASQAARRLGEIAGAELVIVNRSDAAARGLAAETGGRPAPLEELHRELAAADFAVLAAGGTAPFVSSDALAGARAARGAIGPLLLVDVGLPRNTEPGVGTLAEVELVNLEGLGGGAQPPSGDDLAATEAIVREAQEELRWRLVPAGR